MKRVISIIAIAFSQTKGNGYVSFEPLVSKPAPEWLPLEKNFKEAQDKGLVRLAQDVETKRVTELDSELVTIAKSLNLVFSSDIDQSILENMVRAKKESIESNIKETKVIVPVTKAVVPDTLKDDVPHGTSDIEQKRIIIEELQGLGFNGANVKWKLETLENKLAEVKDK